MSCYRIYYQEGVKKLAPVNNRESYLRLRHCGRQKNLVGQARKGNDEAKRRLLQCNYSCLPAADGKLKGCLHSREEISLKGLHGQQLETAIRWGIRQKPQCHHLTERPSDTLRTMNQIGG